MPIEASATLREGRAIYFAENGLPSDGGYSDAWVVVRVRGVPVFAFPNTEGRKRDVPFHDLHHVATGYATDLIGEAEIGAWELGSGCDESPAARFLDCQVVGFMLPRHPRRIFRAFVRGRHSRNLYGTGYDAALLERSVADLRGQLELDRPEAAATPADRRAFAAWAARSLATTWGPLLPLAGIGWWLWG